MNGDTTTADPTLLALLQRMTAKPDTAIPSQVSAPAAPGTPPSSGAASGQSSDSAGTSQNPLAPPQRQQTLPTRMPTQPAAAPAAQAEPQAFNPLSGYGMPGGQAQPNWSPNQVRNYAEGGTGYGPGSGQPTKNALSTIGSGLQQAASAIGSMEGSWHMQQSAIPDPSQFIAKEQQQQIQLQQKQII